MRERFIIHLNVADFPVAVERAVDVRLRGNPVIIAPEGALRAVVYDMSEEAYQSGVRKGMPLRRALRRCPKAVVLPPHPARYEQAMVDFLKHALPYSPLVEVADCQGHLFIDATGIGRLFGPPPDLAWRIRKNVRAQMGFDPIWSVAPNKLVAKAATRIVKPVGEYIVGSGEEEVFLKPLPVHLVPGIESDDLKFFYDFNLTLAGEVARLSMEQLSVLFGSRSQHLHDAVRGIDTSPVFPFPHGKPVITVDYTFGDDTNDVRKVEAVLFTLVEQAGMKLRRKGLAACRLRVFIDYSDGGRANRQTVMDVPTSNDFNLFASAKFILNKAWKRRIRIRCLRLAADRLAYPAPLQQTLFGKTERNRKDNLISAIDAIRNRFGRSALQVGRVLAA